MLKTNSVFNYWNQWTRSKGVQHSLNYYGGGEGMKQ